MHKQFRTWFAVVVMVVLFGVVMRPLSFESLFVGTLIVIFAYAMLPDGVPGVRLGVPSHPVKRFLESIRKGFPGANSFTPICLS